MVYRVIIHLHHIYIIYYVPCPFAPDKKLHNMSSARILQVAAIFEHSYIKTNVYV